MSTPKSILVIDVECCCWKDLPKNQEVKNEIIEIGVVVLDCQTYDVVGFESIIVIPPTTEISDFCTELTSLTSEYVNKFGISFGNAVNKLRTEYKADRNIFASWGDYDRKAFEKNCKWNNEKYPFGNMHLNIKALYAAKYGYTGGVAKILEDLNMKFVGTQHRGIDDAKMIAEILRTIL